MYKQLKLTSFVIIPLTTLTCIALLQISCYGACLERVKQWCKKKPAKAAKIQLVWTRTREQAVYIQRSQNSSEIDHIGIYDCAKNFHILRSGLSEAYHPKAATITYASKWRLQELALKLQKRHEEICQEYANMPMSDSVDLLGEEGTALMELAHDIAPTAKFVFVKQRNTILTFPSPQEIEQYLARENAKKSLFDARLQLPIHLQEGITWD